MLIKGGTHSLPIDLKQQAESGWDNHFKDYANDKTTREDQKTQAYCRAKLANLQELQPVDPTNGPNNPILNL